MNRRAPSLLRLVLLALSLVGAEFGIGLANSDAGARAQAAEKSIIVASTTSTQDSGLFAHILPRFTQQTGIAVKVVAQGTGQALDTGRRGDADVVFVHARAQEEKFVADGFGVKRHPVMYNDFVLIGPAGDPAGVKGTRDILAALRAIAGKGVPFISRGDRSGTHAAELALWRAAGIDPHPNAPPRSPSKTGVNALSLGEGREGVGAWYKEIGQGMGAALNTAQAADAYLLADCGSWIAFKNKGGLTIAVEGDTRLFNQYGVILVDPARHPHVKKEYGQAFIDWLISPAGQSAINDYTIGGQQLFFANANAPGA